MGTQPIPSSQQCCHAHSNVQEFLKGAGCELQKSNNYPTAPVYDQKPISCSQYWKLVYKDIILNQYR